MQHTLTRPPFGPGDLDVNPTFDVVIAYEDFETGKHAKKTYDFLVENLGQDCQFSNQMWKFDVLGIPKLRDMAVKDALMADIIIISSHGGDSVPEAVKSWIEGWVAEKSNAIALVALFDCEPEESRAVRTYLSDVAKRAQIEFFAQPNEWPGVQNVAEDLPSGRHADLSGRTLSTLAGVVQKTQTIPRWGINE